MSAARDRQDLAEAPTHAAPSIAVDVVRQARLFAILWAIAHLAHMLRKGDADAPLVWVVVLAALLLIDRPTSRGRLALLAAAELAFAATRLPIIDNHLMIVSFVNLGMLACVGLSFRRRATDADTSPPIGVLPYARLALVLAYGAAALSKLNEGFFDSTASCAVAKFHEVLTVFGGSAPEAVTDALSPALPFLVAGAELAVPILLLIPATRLAGVALTVVFHLVMTFSPTAHAGMGFTFVLFALVFLFLPAPAALHIEQRVRGVARRLPRIPWSRTTWFVVSAVVVAALVSRDVVEFTNVHGSGNWVVLGPAALVFGILLLDAAWRAWRRRWPRSAPLNPRHVVYVALLALVVLNASAPYVGAKTITSFTMYSNLRTEGSDTNHFFLPSVSLASGQDDLVRVIDSSDPWLKSLREQRLLITWHELRRKLRRLPTARIVYERGGEVFAYEEARDNPELVDFDPITARLLAYRLVDLDGARCLW